MDGIWFESVHASRGKKFIATTASWKGASGEIDLLTRNVPFIDEWGKSLVINIFRRTYELLQRGQQLER
jgi:hypothetical protein